MDGREAYQQCRSAITTVDQGDGSDLSYTMTAYAVGPFTHPTGQPPTPNGSDWYTTNHDYVEETQDDYFEMQTEKEIRQLLNEIFLWMSGMGEYPELLAQICPEEIIGNIDEASEEERMKIPERAVAQVLRWVLGEL